MRICSTQYPRCCAYTTRPPHQIVPQARDGEHARAHTRNVSTLGGVVCCGARCGVSCVCGGRAIVQANRYYTQRRSCTAQSFSGEPVQIRTNIRNTIPYKFESAHVCCAYRHSATRHDASQRTHAHTPIHNKFIRPSTPSDRIET